MKIIKQVDTAQWNWRIICDKCESELEAATEDITYKYVSGDFRDPGYDKYTVKCPVCDHIMQVSASKIPKAVQIIIQKGI